MGPLAAYQRALQTGDFQADAAQLAAITALEQLYTDLQRDAPSRLNGLIRRLRGGARHVPHKGLYLWGDVGRGKTYLMDLFYGCLGQGKKRRSHFHRFMLEVHERLNAHENQSDPLPLVARDIAKNVQVLCFDELFVSDIADAMLLGGLFTALFEEGVTLVTTSNSPPDELYAGGLQRERFLPAIDALERNCQVVHLDGSTDHRLRVLKRAEIFHYPLDNQADRNLEKYFERIAPDRGKRNFALTIEGRPIHSRRVADGIIWCDFNALCDGPRGTADYVEIAREFHTVLLSNVPILTELSENQARRFIALVDELYDRNVTLIISAAVELQQLYQGRRLGFEFERTRSRLEEMQSHDYLARPHLP